MKFDIRVNNNNNIYIYIYVYIKNIKNIQSIDYIFKICSLIRY